MNAALGERNRLIRERIARNIRLALTLSNVSQTQLAALLDMPRHRVSEWCTGARGVSDGRLEEIGAALGRELDWFYREHDGGPVA